MAKQKMYRAPCYVIEREGQQATVTIPDGCRLVMIVRGEKPMIAPIEKSGTYTADMEDLSLDGKTFPILLFVIDLAHVVAWRNMSVETVGTMLDRTAKLMDRLPPETPRHQV